MKQYRSNYDKFPSVEVPAAYARECTSGWDTVVEEIRRAATGEGRRVVVVDCYQGVLDAEVATALQRLSPTLFVDSAKAMRQPEKLNEILKDDITDDAVFGFMTRFNMEVYFDAERVAALRRTIEAVPQGLVLVYGIGAAYVQPEWDVLIYADMARWEIQRRFRKNLVGNIGVDNRQESASLQYKRAFFVDWRICDRWKKRLFDRMDYILDTNEEGQPRLATARSVFAALEATARRPFRVVPFFDPGPWGGQWMKEVCDLDRSEKNFAWCFDCVPEEDSLLLQYDGVRMEIPSIDLVFREPHKLLGEAVHGRFGDEFPIRFDFLDTMDGGNLSLQVHPLTEYIREQFGMFYTQDESYYLLDAADDACVYLGMKEGGQARLQELIDRLEEAQRTGEFDAEQYIGRYSVRKHDHVLIPGGTIHCSGRNSMVLEISATPFIFTFKLWDWGRMGLDGKPRPINIGHGSHVIQPDRDQAWVRQNLLNQVELLAQGDGWREERTGLHEREFIETRRHWFTGSVEHDTQGGVNVLNLVEGREAIVESPTGAFEPFVVHYAETFIIPAAAGRYTIRPWNEGEGSECATIKAYVRTKP